MWSIFFKHIGIYCIWSHPDKNYHLIIIICYSLIIGFSRYTAVTCLIYQLTRVHKDYFCVVTCNMTNVPRPPTIFPSAKDGWVRGTVHYIYMYSSCSIGVCCIVISYLNLFSFILMIDPGLECGIVMIMHEQSSSDSRVCSYLHNIVFYFIRYKCYWKGHGANYVNNCKVIFQKPIRSIELTYFLINIKDIRMSCMLKSNWK